MNTDPKDTQYQKLLLGLNDTRAAGGRELMEIERVFGSLSSLLGTNSKILSQLSGLSTGLAKALRKESLTSRSERVIGAAQSAGLQSTTFGSPDYPQELHALANPPLALFYRGHLPLPGQKRVAVVGSRLSTRYGKRIARQLARDLAARGIEVTSGLARGIDREAHEGALEAEGVTHGVLGCGLPRIYPDEHRSLAASMTQLGSVICEFSPGTPPLPGNFPRRNRIIAALCDALILVEAKQKSGGLITVRWAADLGRSVFVVPGQIDNPTSEGCLALMRDGVPMIRGAEDLLNDMKWRTEEFEIANPDPHQDEEFPQKLTAAEQRLLACLDHEAIPLETLLPALDQTPGQVLTGLLSLELKGLVLQESGMRFRKT